MHHAKVTRNGLFTGLLQSTLAIAQKVTIISPTKLLVNVQRAALVKLLIYTSNITENRLEYAKSTYIREKLVKLLLLLMRMLSSDN
jgi:hypothetical protein